MKRICLSVERDESILAVMNNGQLEELLIENALEEDLVGRIYKGVVKNLLPSVNGIFIDIGIGQNAFLRTKDLLPGEAMPTEGSTMLVQVVKEGTALKGPLVTAQINLSGTYAVAVAGQPYIGVSKKIQDEKIRNTLRQAAEKYTKSCFGLIIRTAAEKVESKIFEKDIEQLACDWNILQNRYGVEKAPALLWRDSDLVVKALRYFANSDTDVVLTNDKKTYNRLCLLNEDGIFIKAEQIQLMQEGSLLKIEHIEEQIQQLLERRVELKSGGFIVIDYTEALTAIDVNSGGFQGRGIPHEELAYLINKEAAKEIARQIKLRSIGGMILIDFIDMKGRRQKEKLLQILREETKKDREKVVVCGITDLGLVEMTRKRTGRKLENFYYDVCPLCDGTGRSYSPKAVLRNIYRELRYLQKRGLSDNVEISCHPDVAAILRKKEEQKYLSQICTKNVIIRENNQVHRDVYSILTADE